MKAPKEDSGSTNPSPRQGEARETVIMKVKQLVASGIATSGNSLIGPNTAINLQRLLTRPGKGRIDRSGSRTKVKASLHSYCRLTTNLGQGPTNLDQIQVDLVTALGHLRIL